MKKTLHYLEYIAIIIAIQIIRPLGIDKASYLLGHIARALGPLHKSSIIARKNLKVAFPKWPQEKINVTIKDIWENLGRTIAELPFMANLSEEEIKKRVNIKNAHLLNSKEKRFILVSGHFANWEIQINAFLFLKLKPSVIYRKSNNPLVDQLINKLRYNQNIQHIPKGTEGLIKMVKTLNMNNSIAMLVDQKLNTGIKAKFLNKEAMTTTIPAKLSLKYNTPIIYTHIVRNKGAFFTLTFKEIKTPQTSNNSEQEIHKVTQTINNTIEKHAKEHPGQWFWLHRRFDKKFYQ